jgi:hypothetical protein
MRKVEVVRVDMSLALMDASERDDTSAGCLEPIAERVPVASSLIRAAAAKA